MTYTNHIGYSNPPVGQCNWDFDWYSNQQINDLITSQQRLGHFTLTGGELSSPNGLNIDIADATTYINGNYRENPGGTLALTGGVTDELVFNIILLRANGTVTVYTLDNITTNSSYAIAGIAVTLNGAVVMYRSLNIYKPMDEMRVENDCVNGTFDSWQVSDTMTGTGSNGADDLWRNFQAGTTTRTVTKRTFTGGQVDVPGNPTNYSETVVVSGNTASSACLKQYRKPDVRRYSDEKVVVVAHFKSDAERQISIEGQQRFGTGTNSPSANVTGLSVAKFDVIVGWNKIVHFIDFPSISDKIIGDNEDSYNVISFWYDAGADFNSQTDSLGNQSGTFDIAEVKIYPGSRELPTRRRDKGETLEECRKLIYVIDDQYNIIGYGRYSDSTTIKIAIPTSVKMMMAPTASTTGSGFLRAHGNGQRITDVTISSVKIVGSFLELTLNGTFGAIGVGQAIIVDQYTTDKIIFDASL